MTTLPDAPRRISQPIDLPDLPEPPGRRPFPILASLVPVVGAVVMWRLTGSIFMLWFAALGPFMAIASLADGARSAARERKRAQRALGEACDAAEEEIARRHDDERALRRAASPDVVRTIRSDGWVWRRPGQAVVGTGTALSAVRVSGGEGDRVEALRTRAEALENAPVTVPWQSGVCVRGPEITARAVARALALQVLLRTPPREVRVIGDPLAEGWAKNLPHVAAENETVSLALIRADEPVPVGASAVIAVAGQGDPIPHECAALIEIDEGLRGRLIADTGDVSLDLEAISVGQAHAIAATMAGRAGVRDETLPPGPVPLANVLERDQHDADRAPAGLRAVIGLGPHTGENDPPVVDVDLVADGPHAVVVGTTGAGKSELLTTWITALAASAGPGEVVFLLGDFKGGTAFEHLRMLPHVTGIMTDLDGGGALRAVEGLRAEIRRRELVIAAAGARDIGDPRVRMARLVIVIDEFAALLQEHPDLHAVFTDVAARGRGLGMHLVLGTQRASGILRDALVANSPLRIALRVAETSESSQLIGADVAAKIPGDAAHRGVGYVKRAGDTAAHIARFALTRADDVRRAAEAHGDAETADGPLLAPLPARWQPSTDAQHDVMALGIADDPATQSQPHVTLRPGVDRGLLVIGGAGTGKTTTARWIADQARRGGHDVVEVPRDTEGAWDALERAESRPPALFIADDADALLARFPTEHAQAAGDRLEAIVRDGGITGTTVILTVARLTGGASKVADLLPRRAVLALPTASDHTASGAPRDLFDPKRPPGRAVIDGLNVQLAMGEEPSPQDSESLGEVWRPTAPISGLVVRAAARRSQALRTGWGTGVSVVVVDDLPPGTTLAQVEQEHEGPIVLAGDGDAWQRAYALLQQVRSVGDMVVAADCANELRTLVGERDLPPYARPRASRAWFVSGGAPPRRIVLP
ncbi:FtsK/SpoIIIE domain-containing protein [Microbacterium amylolyticum]|uniref:S-DNA-T family DNA segregation ATPase FtsK/SpoIIIE n=1 Tax=Microbacterium amylolyticum TaxID=936337 RepID=A0ABS4ZGQ3_9MICO|nr:FtsK/SpoIIIE domain-containing protein [Microbacterium amylolyticum]MBP2436233.1 S-DNA-T family DNA segregation ATPase FtsK/SpoIIIE [Microbacterium amylolyticum]